MIIGGLQKTTLLDYPGKVASTIFTVGCSFRCHFCHNPELVLPEKFDKKTFWSEEKILDFLESRVKLLDALVITGGEPTMHSGLESFIKKVRELGLLVKLDTNGTKPHIVERLIKKGLIDYIAMDIKAPWKKYEEVVGCSVDLEKIKKSVKIIIGSGIDHEFRSTVLPGLHSASDIIAMARQVKGADAYFLQQFRPAEKLINEAYVNEKKFTLTELEVIRREIKDWFKTSKVR